MSDICFCNVHVTNDIGATTFLDFPNVIGFTVEQDVKTLRYSDPANG